MNEDLYGISEWEQPRSFLASIVGLLVLGLVVGLALLALAARGMFSDE